MMSTICRKSSRQFLYIVAVSTTTRTLFGASSFPVSPSFISAHQHQHPSLVTKKSTFISRSKSSTNTRILSSVSESATATISSTTETAAGVTATGASMTSPSATAVRVSDAFYGGNIEYLKTTIPANEDEDPCDYEVSVNIKPDPYTDLEQTNHFQYFSFRSTVEIPAGATSKKVKYVIENAGRASYAPAWDGSTVCYSHTRSDPDSWKRKVDSSHYDADTGTLSWTHTHTHNKGGESAYFAYFPPFSYERHLELIEKCAASEKCVKMASLGHTLDGREMECITAGTGPLHCWIIHQQHPGENMAEFYAEGLLTRLLGLETNGAVDGTVTQALKAFTFHIVPNMCPDGAARGHLRTNACGSNLNREWNSTGQPGEAGYYEAPTMERSPEVFLVLQKMDETGVDVFLDIHGDEELPYNFLAGAEGMPNWGPRLEALQGAFLASYNRANSDMNTIIGYEPEPPQQGKQNVCSNQIAYRFDCLGMTLEMPFKDCASNPDPERGWSPARCRMLGASVLDPLLYVHSNLRTAPPPHGAEEGTEEEAVSSFWKRSFPRSEDAYICPTSKYK